jgi:hypothetical protein
MDRLKPMAADPARRGRLLVPAGVIALAVLAGAGLYLTRNAGHAAHAGRMRPGGRRPLPREHGQLRPRRAVGHADRPVPPDLCPRASDGA